MATRRTKLSRRLAALLAAAVVVLAASVLAGVVSAAHRDAGYRHAVDRAFAAAAGALVVSSNVTGVELTHVLEHPGSLGRQLLESRLQALQQVASTDGEAAQSLAVPPPDAGAFIRLADTLRLRAEAVTLIRVTIERLLGLTPINPAGTAGPEPKAGSPLSVAGAQALLTHAGEQLVLADRTYRGLAEIFEASSGGARLPGSRWTFPSTGALMPATLSTAATSIGADPRLRATIELRIAAVETNPLELPVGPGYPVTPTTTFTAAVSVLNLGSAPTTVEAIIRVRPLGRSRGHFDSGKVTGAVAADGAVALQLPIMSVAPGEHCLVTIDIVHPRRQRSDVGLTWVRTVVIGQNAR